MEITPDKQKIVGLVEQANLGKLCLPQFQRDFVWPRDQVADLLRSILRRYFIGSVLLLRCDPNLPPFKSRFFIGSNPTLRDPKPEMLVLDGQQRITALLYAMTAPEEPFLKGMNKRLWFFVDLMKMIADPDDDDIVVSFPKKELNGLDKVEAQYQQYMLPCTKLMRAQDFHSWRDGLDDWLREKNPSEHERFRKELRDKWTEIATDFQTRMAAVIELPLVAENDTEALGRVCAIFEKLNTTGVSLSVYDLLTARLYRSNIDLHELWDEASQKNKFLREWSEGDSDKDNFGVLMLRTLALLRGFDPKPRFIINLNPENFKEDWLKAVDAVEQALKMLAQLHEDGFGVFDQKWIPGMSLLPILSALRYEIESRRLGEGPRNDLRRWYWSNVFLERYSSAVESKSRKDYSEFLAYWTKGGNVPGVFLEANASIGGEGFNLKSTYTQGSSTYRGVFCLMAIEGARDWRRGEHIQLQELQDHHIYPRNFLKKQGLEDRQKVNCILNRTLISDETNNKIKDKAPGDYIVSKEIFGGELKDELLAGHFVSSAAKANLKKADGNSKDETLKLYEEFKELREKTIVEKIRRVCGVKK